MCNCACADVVSLTPQIGVVAVQGPPVGVVAVAGALAVIAAAVPVGVVRATPQIGVVAIDQIRVGPEGDCDMDKFKVLFTNAGEVLLLNDGRIATGRR